MKSFLVLVVALALLAAPGDLLFIVSHHTRIVACHDLPNAAC